MNPALVLALDFPTAKKAMALAGQLRGVVPWMKVGLELFTAEGPVVVKSLKDMGFKVFLDLKFHDIPNTVCGAARSAAGLGVDLATLHHAGGERMALAALDGVREGGGGTRLLAITVLTSTSPAELGVAEDAVPGLVARKARDVKAWGLAGVVCSGLEASAVKSACGPDFICLCPGIRMPSAPGGTGGDDQRRIMTPAAAVSAGADFLVVGRPISAADDPARAAAAILQAMK